MEIALSKFCGPDDVITPVGGSGDRENEELREALGYRGTQNCMYDKINYLVFRNHMGYRKIYGVIGKEIWDSYYKFCIERNPWDKVVSYYYWRYQNQKDDRPSMSFFIREEMWRINNWVAKADLYSNESGRIIVDRVCLYENLEEEVEFISKQLDFPEKLQLPNVHSGFREAGRHYREYFTDEERILISELFAREIAWFGYKF